MTLGKVLDACLKLLFSDTFEYFYNQSFLVCLILLTLIIVFWAVFPLFRRLLISKKKFYYNRVKWDTKSKFTLQYVVDICILLFLWISSNPVIIPTIATFLLLGFFKDYGERVFLPLDENRLGIVVSRFYGANVEKHFGKNGFQERIIKDLNSYLPQDLQSTLQIHASNRTLRDKATARTVRQQLRADYIVWGYVEEGSESLTVFIGVEGPPTLGMFPRWTSGDTMFAELYADNFQISLPIAQLGRSERLETFLREVSLWTAITASLKTGYFKNVVTFADLLDESVRADTLNFPIGGRDFVYIASLLRAYSFDTLHEWTQSIKAWRTTDSLMNQYTKIPPSFHSMPSMMLAHAYEKTLSLDSAINCLRLAITRDPTNWMAYEEITGLFAKCVEYDSVRQYALLGLKSAPNSGILRRMLGVSYFMKGDTLIGLQNLKQALSIDSKDSITLELTCLIECGMMTNRSPRSEVDSCMKCVRLYQDRFQHTSNNMIGLLVLALVKVGSVKEAAEILKAQIPEHPCLTLCYADLALESARRKDIQSAEFYTQKFLNLDDNQILNYSNSLHIDRIDRKEFQRRVDLLTGKTH